MADTLPHPFESSGGWLARPPRQLSKGTTVSKVLRLVLGIIAIAAVAVSPCSAGLLVNPGANVKAIVADPIRNTFYVSLSTGTLRSITAAGALSAPVTPTGIPQALAVAPDGSELYVALTDSYNVDAYTLPALTYRTTFNLSATNAPTGLAARLGRLYAVSNSGLSIVDTTTGNELYFGTPAGAAFPFYASKAVLSPDGTRLYTHDVGLSPASIYVYDVLTDTPTYAGTNCCWGCIGSNGRQLAIAPDGSHLYFASGAPYHVQVLGAEPVLYEDHQILTGPYPGTVVASQDGSRVYAGRQDSTFIAARTSDWLPFHVGTLQGQVESSGLALSADGGTLAAVIEFGGFDPNRVELVNVTSLPANRGGVRLRPLDADTGVPTSASFQDSVSAGTYGFIDFDAGLLGRAPLSAGSFSFTLASTGHASQPLSTSVAVGAWTDLGNRSLARSGSLLAPSSICVTPAAKIGQSTNVTVRGLNLLPGGGFAVSSTYASILVDNFAFTDWNRAQATLWVNGAATPGMKSNAILVTNPDTQDETGDVFLKQTGQMFADGFESGALSHWSGGSS